MSEIKYLPVREIARENGKIAHLEYFGYYGKTHYPVVSADVLKTAEDLKIDGMEEYRQALKQWLDYDDSTRVDILGAHHFSTVVSMIPSKVISKLKAYENQPNVGEVWQRTDGLRVVIYRINGNCVRYYYASGIEEGYTKEGFMERFINTGKTCESLISFLEELEGLDG